MGRRQGIPQLMVTKGVAEFLMQVSRRKLLWEAAQKAFGPDFDWAAEKMLVEIDFDQNANPVVKVTNKGKTALDRALLLMGGQ